MIKGHITLTIEFEYDESNSNWNDVSRNLITKIGNLDNDELNYTVSNVYNSIYNDAWEEEENWDD